MNTDHWRFWILIEDHSGDLHSTYAYEIESRDDENVFDVSDKLEELLETKKYKISRVGSKRNLNLPER